MKILQIMGPSYCGSTVLGYMLNTIDNWFFASELYRTLSYHKINSGNELIYGYPFCSICYNKCEYWNPEIKSKLDECENLTEAYNVLHKAFPDIEMLVDGSKSVMWYNGTVPDKRIIATKHPLRLIASYLYNNRRKIYDCETLYDINKFLKKNMDVMVNDCKSIISRFNTDYDDIFNLCNETTRIKFHICKMDQLHNNNFKELNRLQDFLDVKFSEDFFNFGKQNNIHPIGGNQAPLWQVSQKNISDNIRYQYYASANGFMDYKIDNKFHIILDGLIPHVENIEGFSSLATKLGYINEKY